MGYIHHCTNLTTRSYGLVVLHKHKVIAEVTTQIMICSYNSIQLLIVNVMYEKNDPFFHFAKASVPRKYNARAFDHI